MCRLRSPRDLVIMSREHLNPPPQVPPRREEFRVITCIMPAGGAVDVLRALRQEQGIISACAHHARGIGTQSLRHRVYSDEKQVLTALVSAEQADAVFSFLYHAAGLDQPHAGMVMMGRAFRGAGVIPLPEQRADVQ